MKRIVSALLISVLLCVSLSGCGKVFHYDITSTPKKTTIKVMNASNDTYAESGIISIGKNKTITVTSSLGKGELQIGFASALDLSGADDTDDYEILGLEAMVNVKPGDVEELHLEKGDYVLQLLAVGDTNGTVTIDIK